MYIYMWLCSTYCILHHPQPETPKPPNLQNRICFNIQFSHADCPGGPVQTAGTKS